ncbi:MAG: winged helix-turn-helix transcriptional regulator [Solirubrobacteraceae bacterium]
MSKVPPPKRHPYDQWSPDARALDIVGDKWTLLIIRDLAAGPRRFVELQRVLPGISTEQLRSRLGRMVADGLLSRSRYREVPPRVDYELTPRARDLMPVLSELARWGYRWAWSEPRSRERVDIGAIFRLAPGLVADVGATGEVLCRISDGSRDGQELCYTMRCTDRVCEVFERNVGAPGAEITGDTNAWVALFSPNIRDASGLKVTGNRQLAERMLQRLAPRDQANADAAAAAAADEAGQNTRSGLAVA